ncbi:MULTISPECIES: hypothetical protein [Bacteroides]|jgi:hypothetical protein|uniref:hypothetical protein n=1 Tax=Bacteroides TaxID=816 RepID=UPI000E5449DF|nr:MULTISPECIES: hypothetical protein [Bacteroides]RHL08716.1 hypothetical protein DW036_12470 [Bacteroides sp. AF39-11AC]
MAKKHLSEDEIKYIISAETDKAQKEIYALSKATKDLKQQQRERLKSMIELESKGKKESDTYKKLAAEYKAYGKQISDNNKRMGELTRKLDVNVLSMAQLKKQSRDLHRELDNVSKALDPERYALLESQIKKVDERMNELKVSAKSLREISTSETALAAMSGIVFAKLAEKAGEYIQKMKEVIAEGIEMAESADGVKKAFDALDDGTILNNLRKATKGTVTDLDLMKATVQANDFRIPLEDLGKYLQFAQLKAQQTGQSVDYMTNSIVTGLGRKSVMILDNLGLSAAEINEQMSQTGDFMSAVAAIVDKQLAAAGDNYVSSADRAQAATVRFQNAQLELGETLLPIKEKWDEFYSGASVSTMELIGWIVKHRKALILLVTAYTSYIATQKLATIWNAKHAQSTLKSVAAEKLHALQLGLSKKAFLAKLIVLDLYRGRCNLATAATEMFNLVLKASPLGIVTTLITTAAAAFMLFGNRTDKVNTSVESLNKRLLSERTELNNIFNELEKTNPSTNERIELVKELNGKYPGLLANYNLEKASLKDITKAQNEANAALTNRIATEMKAQTTADYVQKNISIQMDRIEYLMSEASRQIGKDVYSKFSGSIEKVLNDSKTDLSDFWNTFGKYFSSNLGSDAMTKFRDQFLALRIDQRNLATGVDEINRKYEPYIKAIKTTVSLSDEEIKKQVESTSIIKKLEKQKEKVQNTWKEDTKENIILKNKEIERLDEEIKKYKELGSAKLAADAKKKADTAAEKARTTAEKEQKAKISTEQAAVKSLEALREEDLQNQQKTYNDSLAALNSAQSTGKLTKQQYEMMLLELNKQNADARLKIEQSYYSDAQSMALTDANTKEDIVRKSNQRVINAEKEANVTRAALQTQLNELIKSFKDQFKLTTVDEDYAMQLEVLKASYQARKEMAEENNLDTTELDKAYYRAKEQLESEYQQRLLAIRNQYGLTTQQERHNAELEQLKIARAQQLLTEEEYEQAVQNLKRDSYKKQFDYYADLFSNAIQSLQQAEMDQIDAKYDAEIEAAKGDADEVERLENEKAQKKLDIQKKYADVNFAIKASQIIADTAVAIMKALGELGPIAGPIFATLMGVTGAAQLASAKAERDKVKNMTLSGSTSSGASTGARVATGRQEGGKIDVRRAQDGKLFPDTDYDPDARGFIDHPTVIVGEGPAGQSKEWVASNAAVENPTVAPILDILDKSQQAGNIRTLDLNQAIRARMAGYASGGSISKTSSTPDPTPAGNSGTALPPELMEKLARSIIHLDEYGVPASVVLSDIERKTELRNRSRSIGSKKQAS